MKFLSTYLKVENQFHFKVLERKTQVGEEEYGVTKNTLNYF